MIKWITPLGRVTHLTMPLIDVQNPIKSYKQKSDAFKKLRILL